MSFDFKKDYDIEKTISENEVLLKRIRKDVPYYNAILKKTATGYSIDFVDKGGTVIKRGIYNLDKTSKMIKTMEFHNLIINTNITTIYETKSVNTLDINNSFFRKENMNMLFSLFE